MITVQVVQIMIILSFLYSIKMKIWHTSLNTFIVVSTMFVLTVSREVPFLRSIWADYHVTVIGLMLATIMSRVVYQSVKHKIKEYHCSHTCTNFNRRIGDNKDANN